MKLQYYIVDAFAEKNFEGSPTGVCVLDYWLDDELMQNIAAENAFPETAFIIRKQDGFGIRFFSQNAEVDLCGHATLATAYVIDHFLEKNCGAIHFSSQVGPLIVERKDDLYIMDLPARVPVPAQLTNQMVAALGGIVPVETHQSRDLFFVLEDEAQIQNLQPDYVVMSEIAYGDGVIVSAKGDASDIVLRAFFPKLMTDEDPVCGSAHCNLTPFWSERLNKTSLISRQLSPRGGTIYCELSGDRVKVGGKVTLYSIGSINLPND